MLGEGEQTFAGLLAAFAKNPSPLDVIPGLRLLPAGPLPPPRAPLSRLDEVSSPYLEGILDAADEQVLSLETVRGCVFKCRFCYYPKSYDRLYAVVWRQLACLSWRQLEVTRRRGASSLWFGRGRQSERPRQGA